MKSRTFVSALAILALAELTSSTVCYKAMGQEPSHKNPCVLVELFTSEGCSSCPPADQVLTYLQNLQPIEGVTVITLSEHVSYWNYLGWSDPYSSEQFSQRQRQFAAALHNSSVYTPQMIVDGRTEFLGSDYKKASMEIRESAAIAKADITLNIVREAHQATIQGRVKFPDSPEAEKVSLYVAVVEDNLHSIVDRGENSGHTLAHSSVVRELVKVGNFGADKTIGFEKTLNIAPSWKPQDLRIVVFAQNPENLRIRAASEIRLLGGSR